MTLTCDISFYNKDVFIASVSVIDLDSLWLKNNRSNVVEAEVSTFLKQKPNHYISVNSRDDIQYKPIFFLSHTRLQGKNFMKSFERNDHPPLTVTNQSLM